MLLILIVTMNIMKIGNYFDGAQTYVASEDQTLTITKICILEIINK